MNSLQPDYAMLLHLLEQTLLPLNKFRISSNKIAIKEESELGGGGLGKVQLGSLRRPFPLPAAVVAIKQISLTGTNKMQNARLGVALAHEVKIWTELDNPHILKLIGVHITPSTDAIWLISPFESNGNIRQYLQRVHPDEMKRLDLAQDVVKGLAYLHGCEPPLCHGDIKPSNVLLNNGYRAVLCDFGLTRAIDEGIPPVPNANRGSSTRYLCPELLKDNPIRTTRSDIWALGCLLLEIYTDAIPYAESDNSLAILSKIQQGHIPAPLKKMTLPVYLGYLLENCWKLTPLQRPTIYQCRETLLMGRQFQSTNGASMTTPTPSNPAPERRASPISKPPLARTNSGRKAPTPPVTKRLKIALTFTWELEASVDCVKFSPDGQFLAACGGMLVQIYTVQTGAKLCTLIDRTIAKPSPVFYKCVRFSPDGTLLATGSEDAQIRLWDIAAGTIFRVFNGHDSDVVSLDFSLDGRTLASGSDDGTVRVWDLSTSANRQTFFGVEPEYSHTAVTSVALSPNGRYVVAGSMDTVIRVWDVAADNLVERLEGHWGYVYGVTFTPDGKGLVSGGLDKTVKYWDVKSLHQENDNPPREESPRSTCRVTFSGHQDHVWSVALSPDDEGWVASGSRGGALVVWNLKSGQSHSLLEAHKDCVSSVDLTSIATDTGAPGGGLLASGSWDRTVRIWKYKFTA